MSANISIKTIITEENSISYSPGASGVIYAKENGTYYALTAAHVVSDSGRTYKAQTTDIPTYKEYMSEQKSDGDNSFIPLREYYAIMPDLTVEYICDECDLAVVSFTSDKKLVTARIAGEVASKGDRIVSIGNPLYEDHFKVTYGKIISGLVTFRTK
ncbi:MAG TPA: serine protease [Candidatus Atribacteria bacterium]|nr:serine protease [Candidatus Atribacteria bacterium]